MKLYFSHPSPFARKARIALREAGLDGQVEEIAINPWADPENYRRLNPFGRVPTLELDDGSALFQSNLVAEYFDRTGAGPALFPAEWADRQPALRRLAFADNFLDCCIVQRMEDLFHDGARSEKLYERQNWSIDTALDILEEEAGGWGGGLDIGLIALACALGYRDFRFADLTWRAGRPALTAWFETFQARPSWQATPFEPAT